MQPLRYEASLADLQDYVAKMETERGLDGLSLDSQCLKLGEEIGELLTAATTQPTEPDEIGSELVDCLILNASIASRAGISLNDALRTRAATLDGASLAELQAHTTATDLADLDLTGLCLRAAREAGELYRAVRKLNSDPADPHRSTVALADTCLEITIITAAFAHYLGIDLENTWRTKEHLNNHRTWQ